MKISKNHLPHRLIHLALAAIYAAAAMGMIDKGTAAGLAAACYLLLALV